MKLIVGLGNPGPHYSGSRHNLGFMCVAHFAKQNHIPLDKKQAKARIGSGIVAGEEVVVARPQTFMNASGESIKQLVDKFKVNLDDLLVIHDDLDLPVGRIRLRRGGGAGGHKGIASIIAALGTPDFSRLRVGIGRPANGDDSRERDETEIIHYVLDEFLPEEKKIIDQTIPHVSETILCFLTEGLTSAMNKYNRETESK